jgi:hypothetical protein
MNLPSLPSLRRVVFFGIASLSLFAEVSPSAFAATRTWDGGGDGTSWGDSMNWSDNAAPIAGDSVVIDVSGTDVVVEYTGGNLTLSSLQCEEALGWGAGTLTLTNGASWVHGGFTMAPDTTLVAKGAGVALTISGSTAIDGGHLYAQNGASLTFADVGHTTDTANCCGVVWEASGAGAVMSFPALTNMAGNSVNGWPQKIRATAGGQIHLAALTKIEDSSLDVFADGANSMVTLPVLAGEPFASTRLQTFEARNNGAVQIPQFVDGSTTLFILRTGGTMDLLQLTRAKGITLQGPELTLPALTNINGADLYVRGGSLVLPGITEAVDTGGCCGAIWEASESGTLSFPALTNLVGNSVNGWPHQIRAYTGGEIHLAALATIEDSNVNFFADGTDSLVALPLLSSQPFASTRLLNFEARNNGTVQIPQFVDGSSAIFTLRSGGAMDLLQVTRAKGLTLQQTTVTLPALTNIDGSDIYVSGGSVVLSGITATVDTGGCCGAIWEASESGTLSFPALTNMAGNSVSGWPHQVRAYSGGEIQLPVLTQIPDSVVNVLADGSNSLVSLPALVGQPFASDRRLNFEARNQGAIENPSYVDGSSSVFTLKSGGTMDLLQVTRLHGLTIQGASLTLSALTNIDGADVLISAGATLVLPSVTEAVDLGGCCGSVWEANGAGVVLNLPGLTKLGGNPVGSWAQQIRALNGGEVRMDALMEITDSAVNFLADGTNSLVSMGSLAGFNGPTHVLNFDAKNSGTIAAPVFAEGNWADFTVTSGGTMNLSLLTRFSGLTVNGGMLTLPGVTNIDGASLIVSDAGSLELPGVQTYEDTSGCCGAVWEANEESTLSLPSLTRLTGNPVNSWGQKVRAYSGGQVQLGRLALIPDSGIRFLADGTNSRVVLTNLTSFGGVSRDAWFDASNSGVLELTPGPFSATRAQLTVLSGGQMQMGSLALYPGTILRGDGLFEPNVFTYGGTVTAGTSPGQLTLGGDLVMESGIFAAEIGGIGVRTNYDRVVVNGSATLNGTLQISRLNNFVPDLTNTFTVLTASSITGAFTNTAGLDAGSGVEFVPNISSTEVTLSVIPSAGPRVIASTPTNSVDDTFDSLRLTFSEPVLVSSISTSDATLLGPGGAIAISSFSAQSATNFTIRFATQTVAGDYTFTVGPNITDIAGNPMDQDGDLVNGEAGQDAFQTTVSLVDGAPPAIASVTPATAVTFNVSSLSIVFTEPVDPASFTAADVVLTGPGGVIGLSSLTSSDNRTWTAAFATQSASGNYSYTIGPAVQDTVGNVMEAAFMGGFAIDRSGPSITGTTPSGSVTQAVAFVDLRFNEPLNTASFTASDVALTGPAGTISISSVASIGGSTYRVAFAQQAATGTYTLLVGPNLTDVAGNLMNQDGDGSFGEATEDRYTNSFTIYSPDLEVLAVSGPTSALPGETVSVSWLLTNAGNAAVSRNVTELVSLSTDAVIGDDARIASVLLTNWLAPGGWLVRTQSVTLPVNGPAGALRFVVHTDSNNDVPEGNETNNLAISDTTLTVPQALTLQLSGSSVAEGGVLRAVVSRNGSSTAALSVALASSDVTELAVTNGVVIPAGQTEAAFGIMALPDAMADGPQAVSLTASATAFQSATGAVTALDMDVPALSLIVSNAILGEGQSAFVGIVRQGGTTTPLTVQLGSSSPGQLNVPATITIPAGQVGVAFQVTAVDDAYVETTRGYSITAGATGFSEIAGTVTVFDNDQPTLMLTLDHAQIREGAGPEAATLTITRVEDSSLPVEVRLSANLANELEFAPSVTFSPGEKSIQVPVSPKDDFVVETNRTVTLTAQTLETLSLSPILPGISVNIVVLDDDGPSLAMAFSRDWICSSAGTNSTLASVTARLNRTGPATDAATVSLASDQSGVLSFPATVQFSAGQTQTVFNITLGGTEPAQTPTTVTLTANATGLASAVGSLQRLNDCAPDLLISSLVTPTNGLTDAYFSVQFREVNVGAAFAITNRPPGVTNISQKVFLSVDPYPGNDSLVGSVTFSGQVNPYVFLDRNATFRLPGVPGDYWVVVEADGSNDVAEASEGNNFHVPTVPIHVEPAYAATVAASVESAPAGTPVTLSGSIKKFGTTQPAPFELVSIHLGLRGTTRIIAALSDASGNFSAVFTPLPGEAGTYTVGAAHPGVAGPVPTQDTFTLVGMKATPATLAVVIPAVTTVTQRVALENLGDVPLSGLDTEVIGLPNEFDLAVVAPSGVASFGSGELSLAIGVNTDTNLTRTFTVRTTSAEGAVADVIVTVTSQSLRPRLVAVPGGLSAGVVPGAQRFVEFTVVNEGGATSGPLTIQPPALPFLRVLTPPTLPALAPGASNVVSLQLAPAATQPLGLYVGDVIVSDGAASVAVPTQFRIVSTNAGSLLVEVTDQFTYYAEGAPRVTNAVVELKNPYTGAVLLTRTNGPAGMILFTNLTEGYYAVGVTADEHEPFRDTVFVTAGDTTYREALMSRETVQFYWTVEPTELGDRTKISIEAVFETVVPLPVVTISPSVIDLADYPNGGTINLTITNHGLLAAQEVKLGFSDFDCWKITPLISDIGTLAARSSIVVPVAICRDLTCSGNFTGCTESGGSSSAQIAQASVRDKIPRMLASVRGQTATGSSGCGGGGLTYLVPCGTGGVGGGAPVGVANAGGAGCGGGFGSGGAQGGGGGGAVFAGSSGGNCNPCAAELALVAAQCVLDWALPLPDIISCMKGSYECYQMPSGLGCASAVVSCLEAAGKEVPILGDVLDALSCADNLLSACGGSGLFGGGGPGGGPAPSSLRQLSDLRRQTDAAAVPYPGMAEVDLSARHALAVLGVYTNFFGGENWLQAMSGARFGDWIADFNAATGTTSEDGDKISLNEKSSLASGDLTFDLPSEDIGRFLDRWNRTIDYRALGILNSTNVPAGQSRDFIAVDLQRNQLALANAAIEEAQTRGYTDVFAELRVAMRVLRTQVSQPSGGICAQVRLRIDQEAVIARDAFRASLEIVNDSSSALSNITVNLVITDSSGSLANPLFALPAPVLSGLDSVTGTGLVDGGGRGSVAWTIVPTTESAPATETVYYVGGSIHYTQNGAAITVPLASQQISVFPLAQLAVTYFHQRDVLGDDPFTDEVEPSVPYSLATMIKNTGAGTARNVRITSAQPLIVENEKGLFIDFQIIATEVAGQNVLPSLTANFGDIAPGQIAIGRWLLKSTLQGLFVEYSATFEHLDGLGDPRASIIQNVDIRELIRVVTAPGIFHDGLPDMLVNDFEDAEDLPDALYLSDGSVQPVRPVQGGSIIGTLSPNNLQVTLQADLPGNWAYLRARDPGQGLYRLKQVIRADNVALSVGTNAWTTDRTFIGGGRAPIKEHNLHLLDYNSPGSYTLVYEPLPVPDVTAPVSAIAALPSGSFPQIPLIWSGTDAESGIASFDIYVSDNSGPFTLWLNKTALFGAVYPGEDGHTYSFYSVARDQAGNAEAPPPSADATTTVNRMNSAPIIQEASDVAVDEGATVSLANTATDADSDVQTLTFSLLSGAPLNASIQANTGLVTWRTGEGNGPSTNVIGVIVTDSGSPALSATGYVQVIVNEVNQAPVIAAAGPFTLGEGVQFSHTFTATDSDLPTNSVHWSLGTGAPAGTAIGFDSGAFTWTPTPLQGPSTNVIEIIATDSGSPAKSSSRFTTFVVRDSQGDFILAIGRTNVFIGESNAVPVLFEAGTDLADVSFTLTTDDARLGGLSLRDLAPGVASASLVPVETDLVAVSFTALPGQTLPVGTLLASLAFQTFDDVPSAFVHLVPHDLIAETTQSEVLTNGLVRAGRVVVIGEEPLLEGLNPPRELILWATPGFSYRTDFAPALGDAWQPWSTNTPTGARTVVPVHEELTPVFYRALRLP